MEFNIVWSNGETTTSLSNSSVRVSTALGCRQERALTSAVESSGRSPGQIGKWRFYRDGLRRRYATAITGKFGKWPSQQSRRHHWRQSRDFHRSTWCWNMKSSQHHTGWRSGSVIRNHDLKQTSADIGIAYPWSDIKKNLAQT